MSDTQDTAMDSFKTEHLYEYFIELLKGYFWLLFLREKTDYITNCHLPPAQGIRLPVSLLHSNGCAHCDTVHVLSAQVFCLRVFPEEIEPSYEVHIWKILLLFQVRALETNGYGEGKAKKALSGVWNSQEVLGNQAENKYEPKSKHY